MLYGWLGGNKLESACAEPWTRPSHPTHCGPAQSGALCSDRDPHRSCELLLSEPLGSLTVDNTDAGIIHC